MYREVIVMKKNYIEGRKYENKQLKNNMFTNLPNRKCLVQGLPPICLELRDMVGGETENDYKLLAKMDVKWNIVDS